MNYEEFIEYIKEHFLGEYVSYSLYVNSNMTDEERSKLIENIGESEVLVRKIKKNNGIILDAVSIYLNGSKISPNIYLRPYYEMYVMGKPMDVIISEIIREYEVNKNVSLECTFDCKDYNSIKDKIFIKLVNYELNKDMLKDVVYKKYLDLAITYRIAFEETEKGFSSVVIDKRMFNNWSVLEEELYETALKNTMKMYPYCIEHLTSMLYGMYEKKMDIIPDDIKEEIELISHSPDALQIYILSNTVHIFGAACILYKNVLRNFTEENDCNVYILPSSLHECMLVLDEGDVDPVFLKDLLVDANRSSVGLIDLLSDNVYYYDREKDEISLCDITIPIM